MGVGIKVEYKRCKSNKIKKNGNSAGKQRYMCKECGKTFLKHLLSLAKRQKIKQF